ncbi:MAG: signal recognition particle subunit SRP19/SEC65 family protein [Methanoregula sp.]|jgi:signal recognition particle subunit SRP19
MAQGECIIYPCYFNIAYTRHEGRRVPRNLASKAPVINDLERALKKAGVPYRVDDHHHPAHWARREGRIIAEWEKGKEELIRKIAQRMETHK